MDLISILTLVGGVVSGLWAVFTFVVSVPNKIEGIVAKRLGDYFTKLEIVTQYVSKAEHAAHADRVEKELRHLRKLMAAIARQMKVPVDDIEDE